MIGTWLTEELTDLFTRDPRLRVALWFDEKGEFARLLDEGLFPPGDASFVLLRYELDEKGGIYHGQLWLKAQMVWETRDLSRDDQARRQYVLYLPFPPEALEGVNGKGGPGSLEYLLEYQYRGRQWLIDGHKPTLFAFLRKHGVPLPQAQKEQRALWEGGRESLLAKFADRDSAFWKQPLDANRANQAVIGDLEEHLFTVLSDPQRAVPYLAEHDLIAEFEKAMAEEFGFTQGVREDPSAWVKGFTVRLAVSERYEGHGQPADCRFLSLVPYANVRERWLRFWKRSKSDRDRSGVYQLLIRETEAEHDLTGWATDKPGNSQAFYHLPRARWERCFEAFKKAASSRAQVEAFLAEHEATIGAEADGYWAKSTGSLPGWGLLAEMCDLVNGAHQALTEGGEMKQPAEFVTAYYERWHQVDGLHWRILTGARQQAGMEPVLAAANLWYLHFLSKPFVSALT